MKAKRLTPIFIVDTIERQLPFWMDQMGYRESVRVPEKGPAVFIMAHKDQTEIMLQTRDSVLEEVPTIGEKLKVGMVIHYMEVDDLDAAMARFKSDQIIAAERHTFYGTRECIVEDLTGNLIEIAQRLNQ